jgi:hypothetical protein
MDNHDIKDASVQEEAQQQPGDTETPSSKGNGVVVDGVREGTAQDHRDMYRLEKTQQLSVCHYPLHPKAI